jgi:uncharacterized MnhB-related membrane protein
MWYVIVAAGILLCAVLAVVSKRLLVSAIWLAITSALVAVMLYMLGAPQIAVIELSVGAGLVTVLFVFAINISGEEPLNLKPFLPKPVAWGLVIVAAGLTLYMLISGGILSSVIQTSTSTASILWNDRYLDILLQIGFIFCGVLGVLGILSGGKPEIQTEDES